MISKEGTRASDQLFITRGMVMNMLHIPENVSYEMFPVGLYHGHVMIGDVRRVLAARSRNGARWNAGDTLLTVTEASKMSSISRRSIFRSLGRVPHFRISRKTVLLNLNEWLEASRHRFHLNRNGEENNKNEEALA